MKYKLGNLDLSKIDEKRRKKILSQSQWFEIREGFLTHKYYKGEEERRLIVVPYKYRQKLLNIYHDMELAGHRGKKAVLEVLLRKYYWPGMKEDISRYVESCRGCTLAKASGKKNKGMRGDFGIELGKFEHLHVDFVGPLGTTVKGNRHIFTMIDRTTGWCDCVPTADKKMSTAAEIIYKRWIVQRGAPLMLTADGAFRGELMSEMSKRCGYKQAITSAYHPQSNGKVERMHRDLKAFLKIGIEKTGEWDQFLPGFIFAHNNSPRRGEGYTPAFLVYGKEMRYPVDLVHEELRWEDEETQVSRMMIEMKMAKKIIEARRRREKQKGEEKRPQFRPTEFDVGDTVFIFRPKDAQGAAGKLWLGYVGPYKVREKLPGG
jgi:hypothetical protein